jgi:aryl-alcohol dehydrogenase-like predicted oxidoreductase
MQYRPLGSTGLQVSAVSFGAGPVADLMTAPQRADDQRRTIARAIDLGVNWFDTAATYGDGRSEAALGQALDDLNAQSRVYVATKVRLPPDQLHDIPSYIRHSVEASLERLRLPSITLLQLHNSVTRGRGDLATSIIPEDVLEGGVLKTFEELRSCGVVQHLGLTALGEPESLAAVLQSRQFAAVQLPYNLLNPSAGRIVPPGFTETNLGNLLATCQELSIGAMAIRVYAGGALAGQSPSKHTLTTKFFPLDLYQRDQARAKAVQQELGDQISLPEIAVRFVLGHPALASALIGFGSPEEVEQAVAFAQHGPLPDRVLAAIEAVRERQS